MEQIKYFCDACGKEITEKRIKNNYWTFYKCSHGEDKKSLISDMCFSCEKKFNKLLEGFFKFGSIEWKK